jgi:serine/threonine-protein kinase
MSFHVGDAIDAYKITGVVGAGGMGQVFEIEHTITQRVEAMKTVLYGESNTDAQAQRFLREIQAQARLNHPNIASVYTAFWVEDELVMVMELVKGETLQRVLERGSVPLVTGLDYVCQALAALAYAHAHGVVHRDVTPANLIITPDGVVKLADFGLARAPEDQRITRTGAVMGSPYYTSPEQIRGTATLDARTDIYSIGVVLYELATGQKPFHEDDAFSTMRAHVERMPVPPVEIDPALPPALNEIILTALSKEPESRFSSADLFRESLERVKAGLGSTPVGSSWVFHFSSCLGISRIRRIGAAAVTLLLSIGLSGDLRPLHSSDTRDTIVFKDAAIIEGPQHEAKTSSPTRHRASKKSHNNLFSKLFGKIAHPHRHASQDF